MNQIEQDVQNEALRLMQKAQAEGIPLRLLGGLAVHLHCPKSVSGSLQRVYKDIDLATTREGGVKTEEFLTAEGYTPDKTFNLLNGRERLLFYDMNNQRQVDVFINTFDMCHEIPFRDRIQQEKITLPLAELFLTKIQIVEMNPKDVRDLYCLMLEHSIGEGDEEVFNGRRLEQLCGKDWGLYTTTMNNLAKMKALLPTFELLGEAAKEVLRERIGKMESFLQGIPKTPGWKLRSLAGTRITWYKLPEEVKR